MFTDPGANLSTGPRVHSRQHNDLNDAVEAVEAELGVNPSGVSATVAARFTLIDTSERDAARTTYDPILNQSATVTYTKNRATYRKRFREVVFDFDLSVTGAGTAGTDISIELPFATAANQVGGVIGQGFVFDTSVPEGRAGLLIATSTTYAKFQSLAVGPISYIGSAVVTLAVNDVVRGSGSYEAAA